MPAAIQSAIFEMNAAPPRAGFSGDLASARAFQEHLHQQFDSGNSPAQTQAEVAPAETRAEKQLTGREVAPASRGKKEDKNPDAVSVAMAAAPIPVEPQLPMLPVAGSAPVSKPETSAVAKSPDTAGPLPAPETASASAPPLPLLAPPPKSNPEAKPVPENRPVHDLHDGSVDPPVEKNPAAGDEAQAASQPKLPEPSIAMDFPQLSPESPVLGVPPPADTTHNPLPAPSTAAPAKNAAATPQDRAGKPDVTGTDGKAVAAEAARVFVPANLVPTNPVPANLRALSARLQAGPSLRSLEKDDAVRSFSAGAPEQDFKAAAGDKRNESAPAWRSHAGETTSAVKPPVEKTSSEKVSVEKAPAASKTSVSVDASSSGPQRDAQSAKPVAAEAGGTQPSAGTASFGQGPTASGNPQAAGVLGKPDPLQSPDPNPAPASSDVAQVHSAKFMQNGNDGEMRVGLRTESFGAVQVHTTVSEKQVEVALGSERGDLRSLISSDLPSLQTSLQQHDLRLHEVHSLEHASPERNPTDHASGQSSGNSSRHHPDSDRRHPQFLRDDFLQDDAPPSGDGGDNNVPAGGTGFSIRA